jgi:hypothetical protein
MSEALSPSALGLTYLTEPGKEALMFKYIITLSLSLPLMFGCTTSTRFNTKPEGAKIFINGDYIGDSPITLDDTKSLPSRYHVQIRHEGYKELDMYLDKRADYLTMALSAIPYFAPLLFWGYTLDNKYKFDLSSLKIDKDTSTEKAKSTK